MEIDSFGLEEYMERHTEAEPEILRQLARETHCRMLRPRMLSGNMQGQLLKMLCRLARARRVLEIGTYTGYSALAMASGMEEGGVLHTIDINDELEDFVRDYIQRSGMEGRIMFHVGDACQVIPEIDEVFDLVFIDADKRRYTEYYEMALKHLADGGYIIADNTLWDGHVIDPAYDHDHQTQGIRAFNDLVANDPRVETVILPIRDGLTLLRKL